MKKRRVLFLVTKATWGGAQRYVYDLATHLPKSGFEVAVVYGERGRLAEMLENARIETHRIRALGRDVALVSDIESFFGIFARIARARPDIVHLNSSKVAGLGALAARMLFVKTIVFTVHGWPFNEKRSPLTRAIIYFISWFTALLSNAVIVVSRSDEAQGKRMWLVGKKIRYIPIGIESLQFLSRADAWTELSRRNLDNSVHAVRIVTIAELTSNKGIRYAVEAIALLKKQKVDVEYFIIGDGEERERLQALAQELNAADRIHLLGFIPDASKYLKAFDIFLLPSIKEGMPYVLLEAAAAHLPIVTTDVVNPEFIERAESARIAEPADPGSIAEALVETMREKFETELFPAQNHFPLSEMLEKTIRLY